MKCDQCEVEIAPKFANCPHCLHPLNAPNVRDSKDAVEVSALSARYQRGRDEAGRRGTLAALDRFEVVVRTESRAVITKRWGIVEKFVEAENELFKTFYERIDEGTRAPEDNRMDRLRVTVDALFFPYYSKSIRFACLSLDGLGPRNYGECHFVLRERAIAHRSCVFEENTVLFCQRTRQAATEPVPPGKRALWADRHRLASAKLHAAIDATTIDSAHAGIIVQQKSGKGDEDFIEVHVYGGLDRTSVELARLEAPKMKADRVTMKRVARKLQEGKNIRCEWI